MILDAKYLQHVTTEATKALRNSKKARCELKIRYGTLAIITYDCIVKLATVEKKISSEIPSIYLYY